MKKYFSILFFTLLAIFSSCSKEDEMELPFSTSDLVGTWECELISYDEAVSTQNIWKEQLEIESGYTGWIVSDKNGERPEECLTLTRYYYYASGDFGYKYLGRISFMAGSDGSVAYVGGDNFKIGDEYSFKYIDYNNIMFDNKYFTRIK